MSNGCIFCQGLPTRVWRHYSICTECDDRTYSADRLIERLESIKADDPSRGPQGPWRLKIKAMIDGEYIKPSWA